MRADIDTELSSGFFVSEEAIKKIEDIISKRLQGEAGFKKVFVVKRSDDAEISYVDSSTLITSEENSKINYITSIKLEFSGDKSTVALNFTKNKKTTLKINSTDRDLALLLSADLKEYLKSEVLIRRLAFINRATSHPQFLMASFMLSMIVPIGIANWNRPSQPNPLQLSSDSAKIDFLVESAIYKNKFESIPTYWAIFTVLIAICLILLFSSLVYPSHTFYLGKEIVRYDKAKAVRTNVFWVVFVGLVVGVIGSIIAGKISF